MYFPVLPTVYRKMSVFFCTITSITSLLVTILMFLVLYLGNQVQGIVFISFFFFSYSIYRSMESLFDNN